MMGMLAIQRMIYVYLSSCVHQRATCGHVRKNISMLLCCLSYGCILHSCTYTHLYLHGVQGKTLCWKQALKPLEEVTATAVSGCEFLLRLRWPYRMVFRCADSAGVPWWQRWVHAGKETVEPPHHPKAVLYHFITKSFTVNGVGTYEGYPCKPEQTFWLRNYCKWVVRKQSIHAPWSFLRTAYVSFLTQGSRIQVTCSMPNDHKDYCTLYIYEQLHLFTLMKRRCGV